MHLDPDYPRFWILVTPLEKIGPFYAEEAARVWAKKHGLETARAEPVINTSKWDEDHNQQ